MSEQKQPAQPVKAAQQQPTRYAGVGPAGWEPKPGPWLYLMDKGWKPRGIPDSQYTRWINPKAPLTETQEKVDVIAPHYETHDDDKGKAVTVSVLKPVMVKDRHGTSVAARQVRVTPPGRMYRLDEAVGLQSEWDDEEAQKQGAAA